MMKPDCLNHCRTSSSLTTWHCVDAAQVAVVSVVVLATAETGAEEFHLGCHRTLSTYHRTDQLSYSMVFKCCLHTAHAQSILSQKKQKYTTFKCYIQTEKPLAAQDITKKNTNLDITIMRHTVTMLTVQ